MGHTIESERHIDKTVYKLKYEDEVILFFQVKHTFFFGITGGILVWLLQFEPNDRENSFLGLINCSDIKYENYYEFTLENRGLFLHIESIKTYTSSESFVKDLKKRIKELLEGEYSVFK